MQKLENILMNSEKKVFLKKLCTALMKKDGKEQRKL